MFVIVNYLKKYLTYDVEYSDIQTEFLEYGLDILIQDGLEYTGALITGILMHRGGEALCFLIAFGFLRTCSGGMHAASRAGCAVGFALIFMASLTASALPLPASLWFSVSVISLCSIVRNAPVIHPLCPLSIEETISCRRKAFLRCCILLVLIYCLLFFPGTARILAAFACAVCADDILMRLSLFRKGAEL